ncbi:type II secretion system protein GspM [Shewanella psychromarinicola]|jgi:Tfp pilus assembly protein PilO|uniref:type II secretion system protein GspM n=1 Tax=Shewanella psychromarinicola TaxID=2487742 RepID=UPI003F4C9EBB
MLYPLIPSNKPTSNEQILAVFILLIFITTIAYLGYRLLVVPHINLNQEVETLNAREQSLNRSLGQNEALELEIQEWKALLNKDSNVLLNERQVNLASAALQNKIASIVQSYNTDESTCNIQRQGLNSKNEDSFIRIIVTINMSCSLEKLQAVFYDIEQNNPILILDNINIKSRGRGQRSESQLNITFDAAGFIENIDTERAPKNQNLSERP